MCVCVCVHYRHIQETDIVTPAMGHEVAKDIGAPFYESSVLTKFGISDIFINSARAALIERRKLKFWSTQLRKVQRPLIQTPMAIPAPAMPPIHLNPPTPTCVVPTALASLLYEQSECDVTFVARGVCLAAHRIILAMSCKFFEDLFSCEKLSKIQQHHHSLLLMESEHDSSRTQSVTSDDECLLDNDLNGQVGSPKSNGTVLSVADPDDVAVSHSTLPLYPLRIMYSHPAVESVELKYHTDPYHPQPALMTFITMHMDITSTALQLIFEFLYAGCISKVTHSFSMLVTSKA